MYLITILVLTQRPAELRSANYTLKILIAAGSNMITSVVILTACTPQYSCSALINREYIRDLLCYHDDNDDYYYYCCLLFKIAHHMLTLRDTGTQLESQINVSVGVWQKWPRPTVDGHIDIRPTVDGHNYIFYYYYYNDHLQCAVSLLEARTVRLQGRIDSKMRNERLSCKRVQTRMF